MPKENTHLYFANKISEKIENMDLKSAIKENLDYFYLGSITPDVFFYGKNKKTTDVSEFFHKEGAIDYVKENIAQNPVFSLGILTHIILDDIFHPIIESSSGDYYNF